MDQVDDGEHYLLRCSLVAHECDVRNLKVLTHKEGSFLSSSTEEIKLWTRNKEDAGFHEECAIRCRCEYIQSLCVIGPDDRHPDGVLLVGTDESSVHAYSLTSGEPIYALTGHDDIVSALSAGRYGTVVSGSWDKTAKVWYEEKCTMTLSGHEGAILCVVLVPAGGVILTGSTDSMIKRWRAGKCEHTFVGHTDWVRCLCVVGQSEFLSGSNDGTIRLWSLTGESRRTFEGHSGSVCALACFPNGGHGFVSSGEDGTMRVWKDGKLSQTVPNDGTRAVWTVCVLADGNIVSGASDRMIREFAKDSSRRVDVVDDSESSSTCCEHRQQTEAETIHPTQEQLICFEPSSLTCSQLLKPENAAAAVAESDTPASLEPSSPGKIFFEGKEYDHVFDVELKDGEPPLKLPYSLCESADRAARAFLVRNGLNRKFLQTIVKFILTQTGQCPPTGTDPAKSSNHPSDDEFFPETSFLKYDNINKKGVFNKLHEFNWEASKEISISKDEIDQLKSLVSNSESAEKEFFDVLWRILLSSGADVLFPVLDILRYVLLDKCANDHICTLEDGRTFINYVCSVLSSDGPTKNHLLILRGLCNAFQHPSGEELLLSNYNRLAEQFLKLSSLEDPHVQTAVCTIFLNFVIAFQRESNVDGKMRSLAHVAELSESLTESEAFFRVLVTIGTAATDDRMCHKFARSLDLQNFLYLCGCDDLKKVRLAARELMRKVW